MASHLCHVGPLHHTWVWWRGGRYWFKTPLQPRPTPTYCPLIFIIQPVMEKFLPHFVHLNGISPVGSCLIFPT